MIEETRLEDAYPDIEGTGAASHMDVLHLHQDEQGGVELSPRAQYDLLEFFYERRYALYRATHLSLGDDSSEKDSDLLIACFSSFGGERQPSWMDYQQWYHCLTTLYQLRCHHL